MSILVNEIKANFISINGQIYSKKPVGYNHGGYIRIGHKGKYYWAHHIVWMLEKGELPGLLDHVNGIRSDNRIENLRETTKRQNAVNKKEHRNGHLAGTTFDKVKKRWMAQITVNKKHIFLGRYDTQIEAHEVYMKKFNETENICQF